MDIGKQKSVKYDYLIKHDIYKFKDSANTAYMRNNRKLKKAVLWVSGDFRKNILNIFLKSTR